jgi:transposase
VAQNLNPSTKTVKIWQNRFLQSGIAGLSDLPRSGTPAKFNAMQWLHRYVLLSKAPQSLSGISFT